ncbi:hypothetical protein AB3X96_01950 [Paraburkholderia sp. BR13439]|uniref:hypothetical protein n=1 Tax=Paraburkholderia sp. BR13439 TaxID=3236996 RepID=UPI0034CE4351
MASNKAKIIQSVRNQAEEVAKELTEAAAQQDVKLVAKVSVVPASNFPDWPTRLAEALCDNPALAGQSNQQLASVIEARSGKTGFNTTLISKDLSQGQRTHAAAILSKHGYSTTTLVKGTDIKRIVRDQVRDATPEAATAEISTVFFPDGVAIDGKTYKYRQRNNTPTGLPWNDLCIRLAGVEIPLNSVLKLRGVSIGEFQLKDAAAREFARTEQTVRRQELDREPKTARTLSELARAVTANHRTVSPAAYTGSQLAELIRTWFYNVTVEQGQYVCLGDLLNSMQENPEMVKALEAFVSRSYDDAANDGETEAA